MGNFRIITRGTRKQSTSARGPCITLPALTEVERLGRHYAQKVRTGEWTRAELDEQADRGSLAAREARETLEGEAKYRGDGGSDRGGK